jgi:hypothetical protein
MKEFTLGASDNLALLAEAYEALATSSIALAMAEEVLKQNDLMRSTIYITETGDSAVLDHVFSGVWRDVRPVNAKLAQFFEGA